MTVYDNMAFGLKMQKIAPAVIEERVNWAAQILVCAIICSVNPARYPVVSVSVWRWGVRLYVKRGSS